MSASVTTTNDTLINPISQDPNMKRSISASLAALTNRAQPAPSAMHTTVQVDIPIFLVPLVMHALEAILDGKSIQLSSFDSTISTQQAAEILGVSRSTVVRLINDGRLPCDQTRSHRRLRLDEVLKFKDNQRIINHEAMKIISNTSEDPGPFKFDD